MDWAGSMRWVLTFLTQISLLRALEIVQQVHVGATSPPPPPSLSTSIQPSHHSNQALCSTSWVISTSSNCPHLYPSTGSFPAVSSLATSSSLWLNFAFSSLFCGFMVPKYASELTLMVNHVSSPFLSTDHLYSTIPFPSCPHFGPHSLSGPQKLRFLHVPRYPSSASLLYLYILSLPVSLYLPFCHS